MSDSITSAVLDALREPRYRRLWLAGLCINSARWMDLLVLGWVVLTLTDSPLLVGLAAFCRAAPMMSLGPVAGLVADRFHGGRVLVAVHALNLVASSGLALAFATDRAGLGTLLALAVVMGTAWAVDFPARRTMIYALVGRGRVTNAVSLENVSMQGTKMLGPLLGGLLLARAGPTSCYLLLLDRLRREVQLPALPGSQSIGESLASGLREAWAEPRIRGVLAITVLMNALVFPYQHMLPVLARDVLAVGPALLGLLFTADGLGALIGSLLVAARRGFTAHARVFTTGSLAATALVAGLAVSPWYALALGLQFLIGLAEAGFGTMQSAIVLLAAPDAARGRILGILSACIGSQPLGTLWIGFFTNRAGPRIAIAAGALVALALMLPVVARQAPGPSRERTG